MARGPVERGHSTGTIVTSYWLLFPGTMAVTRSRSQFDLLIPHSLSMK